VLRTAVNECLDPMKEATSNDVAFLVSATPPPTKHTRVGYVNGMGIGSRGGKIYRVTVSPEAPEKRQVVIQALSPSTCLEEMTSIPQSQRLPRGN